MKLAIYHPPIFFRLQDCIWFGPFGQKYYEGRNDDDKYDNNIRVKIDTDDDLCILTIEKVRRDHEGPWQCRAEDDNGDEDEIYVFVEVANVGGSNSLRVRSHRVETILKTQHLILILQLKQDPDDAIVYSRKGGDGVLKCVTNARFSYGRASNGPTCSFVDPRNNKYLVVGKHNERHIHLGGRIKPYGDATRGECAIEVSDIQSDQFGTWKCRVLRSVRSDGRRGSEYAEGFVQLVDRKYRSSRLEKEPTLQGQKEGREVRFFFQNFQAN